MIVATDTEIYQSKLDSALQPLPGDGRGCAFMRAAKVITAFSVDQMKLAKARPACRLTDEEFDDEQARNDQDWFIR
jgi:hypothetical protein